LTILLPAAQVLPLARIRSYFSGVEVIRRKAFSLVKKYSGSSHIQFIRFLNIGYNVPLAFNCDFKTIFSTLVLCSFFFLQYKPFVEQNARLSLWQHDALYYRTTVSFDRLTVLAKIA